MIIGVQMGLTSGCAVYDNGKIIYAASEERFTRKKNDSSYPDNAIKQAIKQCGINAERIEKVVMPSQNMTPVHFLCDVGGYAIEDYIKEQREYYEPKFLGGGAEVPGYLEVFTDRCEKTEYKDLYLKVKNSLYGEEKEIFNRWRIEKVCKDFGIGEEKVCITNHEHSHAAYGIYGSALKSYEDVLCVVYDGYGDESNASVHVVEDGKIKQISKYSNYNVGRLYRYMTLLLGMKPNEHEYKVMGLAPYATEYIYKKPLEVFRKAYRFEDGKVFIDPELKDNYYYFKERLEGMRFDGIAAALQILTEELNKNLIEFWMKKTGKERCILSGGVSMNIKANMEIGKLDCVKDLFVVGSAGDESLCIGAIFAYLDSVGRGSQVQGMESLYLGDCVSDEEIEQEICAIDRTSYEFIRNADVNLIADKLANGYILGRMAGNMEFGARALGNRSILADPRKRDIVERINKKIKNRDFWMPFTPSILEEDAELFLDNPKKFMYPYMSVACETTQYARENLKATIHPADFTARPQLVSAKSNGEYYDLIKAFKDITGIGALLNTSLNIHGYPIVRTVAEGVKVLKNSDLDGLILGRNLILRRGEL